MKTQIELSEEYANFNYHPASEFRSHAVVGFHKGYEAAQPKWISLKDQRPENTGNYLCLTDDGLQMVCSVNQVGWWTMLGGKFSGDIGTYMRNSSLVERQVTYWMPLPSPPKTTEDDNP